MLNNIQDLFLKYKDHLNTKKEIEDKVILFLNKELHLDISTNNLKIDLKNKTVKLINLPSSLRFFLESQKESILQDKLQKDIGFKLIF